MAHARRFRTLIPACSRSFASRLLNGRAPLVNEDGRQRRDFISVRDIVQACRLALEVPDAGGHVFNVGSGESHSVIEVAEMMAAALGREDIEPEITTALSTRRCEKLLCRHQPSAICPRTTVLRSNCAMVFENWRPG